MDMHQIRTGHTQIRMDTQMDMHAYAPNTHRIRIHGYATDTHGYARIRTIRGYAPDAQDAHGYAQIRTRHIHFATFTMLYPYLYIPPPPFFPLRAVAAPPSLETAPLVGSHLPVIHATFTTNHEFSHDFMHPQKMSDARSLLQI